jgi:outer membrane receptor protein involved in Fe transport
MGQRSIALILLVGAGMVAGQALAQEKGPPRADNTVLEEVHVTGTRITRRDYASPSPVFTVSREDLQLEGLPTLESHLNRLPQFSPSFDKTSTNPGTGVATINLRGLGTNRNLVLLDGRRIGPSSTEGVIDINSLPAVMVEKIEVLTGGASAVYGSDAMSGVVNFITRRDFEGLEISGNFDQSDEGDADTWSVNLAAGFSFAGGRGRVTGFVDYLDRDPLLATEREYSEVVWWEDWATGELEVGGSTATPEGILTTGLDRDRGWSTFTAEGDPRPTVFPDDNYNFNEFVYLQTALERTSGRVVVDYQFSDTLFGRLEFMGSSSDVDRQIAPPPVFSFLETNLDNPLWTEATRELLTENYQFFRNGLAQLPLRRRMSETSPRVSEDENDSWRAGFELGGIAFGDWNWNFAYHYTRHDSETALLNALSTSRLQQALLVDPATGNCTDTSDGCMPADVFGPGRISPEAADFLRVDGVVDEGQITMHLATFSAESEFDLGLVEPLGFAVGAEYREEEGEFDPDPLTFSADVIGATGTDAVDGDYDVMEVFAEAYLPLLRNKPLARELSLESGVRYSDHSEVGDIWSWKSGVSWAPGDSLRFRAMFQRAVRAPNLTELYTVASTTEGVAGDGTGMVVDPCSADSDPVGNGNTALCVAQGIPDADVGVYQADPFYLRESRSGGNVDLDPEEADTWTLGLVWEPEWLQGLSLALDWYQIEIKDAIEFMGSEQAIITCFDIGDNSSEFCQSFSRAPDGNIDRQFATYRNIAGIEAEGVDLQFDYGFDFGRYLPGDFQLSLLANWNRETSFQPADRSFSFECQGLFGFPCAITSFGTFPECRTQTVLAYSLGPVTTQLQWHWIDGMDRGATEYEDVYAEAFGFIPGEDMLGVTKLGSENYLDFHAGWEVTEQLRVIAGVNNLTDNRPPLMGLDQQQSNTDPSMYDVIGRRYHLSINWRL